jgi:anti-sigma factor RsiW
VSHETTTHLSDERLQALLDGALSADEARASDAHVRSCAACHTRLETWQTLFAELDDLPSLAPSPSFQERVLEATPQRVGTGARVRGWLGIESEGPARQHVSPPRLQDFLEGRLAARTSARVEAHLDGCTVCRTELADYRAVARAVEALPHLAPSETFSERVMASVRIGQLARTALAPTTRRGRVAAWLRRAVPSTRRAWAAVLGAGVTPAVTVALVAYAVFSHPLVTVSTLGSFVWLKATGLTTSLGESALTPLQEQAFLTEAWSMFEALVQSPELAASLATLVSGLTLGALWVLYRNVIASHPGESGHAEPSL